MPENSAFIFPVLEIIVPTFVLYLSSKPLILTSLIARTFISLFSSVWLNVNLLSEAPILSLAIIESPVPSTFALEVSDDAFTIEYELPFLS